MKAQCLLLSPQPVFAIHKNRQQGFPSTAGPINPSLATWAQTDAASARSMGKETRSRSRGGPPQEPSSSGRRFLFIDASADRQTSSEAVRVHVMREAHRSRRERQGSQPTGPGRRPAAQDDMVIFDRRDASRTSSTTPPNAGTPEERYRRQNSPYQADWPSIVRTGVSQATLDSVLELRCLAEDLLALNAYLALAARQLTSNEQESTNVVCAQFEARALELLRLRIDQAASMHTDATLVAILLLSQLEDKDNVEAALFHRNALRRLIHDRGGLSGLQGQNKDLYEILLSEELAYSVG